MTATPITLGHAGGQPLAGLQLANPLLGESR